MDDLLQELRRSRFFRCSTNGCHTDKPTCEQCVFVAKIEASLTLHAETIRRLEEDKAFMLKSWKAEVENCEASMVKQTEAFDAENDRLEAEVRRLEGEKAEAIHNQNRNAANAVVACEELNREIERLKQRPGWRCFQCGMLLTDEAEAAKHFGAEKPACVETEVQLIKRCQWADDRMHAAEAEVRRVKQEQADVIAEWKSELKEFATKDDPYYNGVRQCLQDVEALLLPPGETP